MSQHLKREGVDGSDDEDEDDSLVGPPIPPGFDPSSIVPGPSSTVLRHQVADESDSDEEQVEEGEESEVTYSM